MSSTAPPSVSIIGALAYDQIATTRRNLDLEALRNAKLSSLRQDFGGCAGNIAYGCARLNATCFPISCVGEADCQPYVDHLERLHIPTSGLLFLEGNSPRGIVITDPNGDQFTGFYPGPSLDQAAWHSHLASLTETIASSKVLVLAAYPMDQSETALKHIQKQANRPYTIWCPGQYADMLDANALRSLLPMADLLVGNRWEITHIVSEVPELQNLTICTDGPNPIQLMQGQEVLEAITVPESKLVMDPTGCGDALLAGLACHIATKASIQKQSDRHLDSIRAAVNSACKLAQECLSSEGCQSY
ncbi:MAG: PfkB family carbohydrate kinase [Pseudomonadota bacterium]